MEINDSLKQLIEKISSALNFFDFTFFISGSASATIVFFTFYDSLFSAVTESSNIVKIVGGLIFIYISGLLSFSAGKAIRLWLLNLSETKNSFQQSLQSAIDSLNKMSDIDNTPKIPYDSNAVASLSSYIYDKMWIDVRHHHCGIDTVIYLNRFVMMQAICEGLLFSCLLFQCSVLVTEIFDSEILVLSTKYKLLIATILLSASSLLIRNPIETLKELFHGRCSLNLFFWILFILSAFLYILLAAPLPTLQKFLIPLGVVCAKICSHEAQRSAEIQIKELSIAYKKFIIND